VAYWINKILRNGQTIRADASKICKINREKGEIFAFKKLRV
jgi:hypothetical protein